MVDTKKDLGYGNKKDDQEFGGPVGVLALMIWSHYILIYFWYCLETNAGSLIIPTSVDDVVFHANGAWNLILRLGIPSVKTWAIYALFFAVQLILASFMPGITMYGLPTAPHGVRLPYNCNGYSCYYLCLFGALLVHFTGVFNLTYIVDHYGEFLIASILIGDFTSLFWYFYGLAFADEHNGRSANTGNVIYDFFMGTILYPRIGTIDIKMVAECRWSWITLMMLTTSCALKQYETTGDISSNMLFMVFAHWLYSNATAKGEHCIPCTWDMFHENFGWMLNFWNVSGVPFLYTFQSMYILKNQALISANYPTALTVLDFTILIVSYYIFDTANSQKANIKIKVERNTFPQLPWGTLEEPVRYIVTPHGNLLVDGWYAFGRKLQYTGDIGMALSWGLACGFNSWMPYFYFLFFTCMINHRQSRDEVRCKEKYGKYWDVYTKQVPNVFFPSLAFFKYIVTGVHPADETAGQRDEHVPSVTYAATNSYASPAKAKDDSEDSEDSEEDSPVKSKAVRGRPRKSVDASAAAGSPSRAKSPAKARATKETKERSTTPSKARATTPAKSRSTTPAKSRSTTPAKQRSETPSKRGARSAVKGRKDE